MRRDLKWVIEAKQLEASPTSWKAKLFKLVVEGKGEPQYEQVLKFTASKETLDEMEFDLNAGDNRVEVPLEFKNKPSVRVACKVGATPE